MAREKKWTRKDLEKAIERSRSYRQTLVKIGLRPAGGNYSQLKKYIRELKLDTSHFKGRAWNKGLNGIGKPRIPLKEILVEKSDYQSYKLKKRLFAAGLKKERCEECGWASRRSDGHIPLELDHVNGNSQDNRLKNLRVLCPNCHSLKPTHRGKNRKS